MESEIPHKKPYFIWTFINDLLTRTDTVWMLSVDEIDPYVLNMWLGLAFPAQASYLDKYVGVLSKQQFYSLCWAVLPKGKGVFIKYPKKKEDEEDEFDFMWENIRNTLGLSTRDFSYVKKYYVADFMKDKAKYFKYYGVEKTVWKKYGLEFEAGKQIRGKFGLALFDDI